MKTIALCFFCLCLWIDAHAEVTEHLDYINYPANADPQLSLKAILNSASPIRENGRVFHGFTKWWVKWHFWWQQAPDGRCKMRKVKVDLSGTITLPRLVGNISDAQKMQFEQFAAALKTHELGHYNNGKQAAYAVEQAILSLPGMDDCQKLESQANNLGMQILKDYNLKDAQYDTTTHHGKTQGAWLN
ncbi:DUF922 domain-containing Zn-dependent protease [Undibacterium sp. Jales W-56]|uniref:DUF922 domain-containing Zn-dependent protease n=1 Tax=Undibacterium sp. Jales W-56 TaxID=2897325 RepID=UPI0021D09B1F|nr:DUF922 domain-containing Zn-dependent protease [Undibacterium sp. Jales W-56]MCU6433012.1 DUF922 domain-containing Zn-dependent protease [Undibacterium sp. Jales W-56]